MNAKSLLGIMSLGVVTGTTVTLSASGPDAEAAVNALDELLQRDGIKTFTYLTASMPQMHWGGTFLTLVRGRQ